MKLLLRILVILFIAQGNSAHAAQTVCEGFADRASEVLQTDAPMVPTDPGSAHIGWRYFEAQAADCDQSNSCRKSDGNILGLFQRTWMGLVTQSESDDIWLKLERLEGQNPVDVTACIIYPDKSTHALVSTEMSPDLEVVLQSFRLREPLAALVLRVSGKNAIRSMKYEFYVSGGDKPVDTLNITDIGEQVVVSGVSLDDAPRCSGRDLQAWRLVKEDLLGVTGWNRDGNYIGIASAKKFGQPNWHPVNGYRETLCGHVADFVPFNMGKEQDRNHFIIPDDEFLHILEVPKEQHRNGWPGGWALDLYVEGKQVWQGSDDHPAMFRGIHEWWDCVGTDDCVETEITPPQKGFHPNPYISRVHSEMEGGRMCAYGPWVVEASHNNRPEIHPSELMWWRDDGGNTGDYLLLMIQDGSERFGGRSNYAPAHRYEESWVKAPLRADFWLPVQLEPDNPRTFTIREEASVHTGQARSAQHSDYQLGGQQVLAIRDEVGNTQLAIELVNACRDASSDTVKAFVSIKGEVGRGADRDDAGFWLLEVSDDSGNVRTTQQALTAGGFGNSSMNLSNSLAQNQRQALIVPGSLRRVADRLMIDIRPSGEESQTLSIDVFGDRDSFPKNAESIRPVGLAPNMSAGLGGIAGLLKEKFDDSSVIPDELKRRMGDPGINAPDMPVGIMPDDGNQALWRQFAQAHGLPAGGYAVRFAASSEQVFDVQPRYAAMRGGSLAVVDGSPVAEQLNSVLENPQAGDLQQLFGNASPFTVAWRAEAKNLVNGNVVPVEFENKASKLGEPSVKPIGPQINNRIIGQPQLSSETLSKKLTVPGVPTESSAKSRASVTPKLPGKLDSTTPVLSGPSGSNNANTGANREAPIQARTVSGDASSTALQELSISLPEGEGVYEVTISATMKDSYDNTTIVRKKTWSHVLVGEPEVLRQLASDALNIKRTADAGIVREPTGEAHLDSLLRNSGEIREEALMVTVERAIVDGRLDLGELQALANSR